jgi:hypothetical protein
MPKYLNSDNDLDASTLVRILRLAFGFMATSFIVLCISYFKHKRKFVQLISRL